jgi:hypothetical protein
LLELPYEQTPVKLADWVELWALLSPDRTASAGDLQRALQREAAENADRERADRTAQEAMLELDARLTAGGDAYPFTLAGNLLTRVVDPYQRQYLPYTFMLCLSYWGWTPQAGNNGNPRHWFEHLCAHSARNFIAGETVVLSPPRSAVLGASFPDAISALCALIGEGGGWRQRPAGWNRVNGGLRPQDDAVDVVAWRHFADRQPGKLVLFGQCASGDNWSDKLTELQAHSFCEHWMIEVPPSQILRGLFIPHQVPRERWDYSSRYGGILFDRCRIAIHLPGNDPLDGEDPIRAWTQLQVDEHVEDEAAA